MDSHVVQVSNVSPSATVEQIHTLFNFLGPIDEFEMFPKLMDPGNPQTKVAFIKFTDGSSVGIAQHLTNTVFIDRPLICVPYNEGIIPDEASALQFVGPANAVAPGMQIGSMDPAKLDEIRRTVYVGNLDSKTATADQLKSFFASCGKVEYVRMAGDETQPTRFAFIEFADVDHVQKAMELNGALFEDRPLKINHSNNAIVKPPVPGSKPANDSTSREIDEAMRRVREAQTLISRALESDGKSAGKRSRSRSRSRHRRRRSRSRDRSRKRRSRSRSYGRSRRSRSRDRRRSRRSRSKSRDRRRKRSRSRSPRKRSSSRSPGKKSSKSHRKDRKKDRDHKRTSKGRERSKSDKPENGEKAKKKENGGALVES